MLTNGINRNISNKISNLITKYKFRFSLFVNKIEQMHLRNPYFI